MRKAKHLLQVSIFLCAILISSAFNESSAQTSPVSGKFTINSALPTSGKNFQTFAEAVFSLANGVNGAVTFDVAPGSGPYTEQVVIGNVKGASATNSITFNCNGVVLTFNSTNSYNRAGVKFDSTNWVTFDSLIVKPQVSTYDEFGYGFHLVRNSDHNTVRKCTVDIPFKQPSAQNTSGIVINGSDELGSDLGASRCDSNIIANNTIIGGNDGIMVWSFTGYVTGYGDPKYFISYNQILNNKIINAQEAGIYLAGGINTIIDGNEITCPAATGYSISGINMTETNYKTIIRNNRIHDFYPDAAFVSGFYESTGISISYSYAVSDNETIVANNLVYGFKAPATQYGIKISTASYVKLFHNTVSLDDAATTTSESRAYFFEGALTNVTMQNNIANVTRGGTGRKIGLYMEKNGTRVNIDRNVYNVAGSGASISSIGGTRYSTLAAMQTAAGIDFQSASADPVFTNAANGNYMPTNPAIDNMGLNVGLAKDIVGATRDQDHPDVGAYEFLTPPCTSPVTAGTTKILPGTTICVNNPLVLNVNGNSVGSGQTYQWQTSDTQNGTYTNIGSALAYPATQINPTATVYYRAEITCGTSKVYSDPIQVIVNPALPAGTYTINSALPTANKNFKSFNDALLSMGCGVGGPVVFDVAPGSGPYNEQVIVKAIANTSPTNTVTFKGNGETLTYLSTNTNQRATVKLDGADYIVFDGLKIVAEATSTSNYGIGVQMLNDADFNVIKNCTINVLTNQSSSNFAGVVINGAANSSTGSAISLCDNNVIDSNKITGGYYGISMVGAPGTDQLAKNNKFTNNTILDFYEDGVYTYGTDGLVIEGNDISKPTVTKTTNSYGVRSIGTTTNMFVSKNKIHDLFAGALTNTSTAYGVYISSTSPATISNNQIYNFFGAGPQYGFYNSSSSSALYYYNTVSLDDTTVSVARATYGFYQTGDATGIELKNNNFTLRRKTSTTSHAISMRTATTVFSADNNNYFISTTGGVKTGYINGTDYALLKDWKAASLQDTNSVAIDPVYEQPASGNLKPSSTVFNDLGKTVTGITTDIKGLTRPATKPDIGAYEFGCSSFPKATFVQDSITVCSGSSVTFQIKDAEATVSYKWYDAATDGNLVTTATSYKVDNLTTPVFYWVEAITNMGCTDKSRTQAKGVAYQKLTNPVASLDTAGADYIRFKWASVPGATGYKVSRDGINFTTPSSGVAGLTHTINGLNAMDTAGIIVKAVGVTDCQEALSNWISGRTLGNSVFVPNTFTPNNDGKNDIFKVYGNTIASSKMMVFNQWGEKIFESTTKEKGWDGTYNGQAQPVGVYVYVITLKLTDGTDMVKKGSLNLIR
ncbi:T9SS type B sorting domain-containing protein [Pinibacter aurantiacus]|uniref:Gliding motility-associated C-terminal domain-containing protein n=1 Tax=Pinibacter aurantiacus TaxID=2851599 RepID=A0A9E2S4S7_9BACT|nr:right-handed parallel beta-helix repeat-containing protein [Pinibacter aurantiacus]MBV4355706.1 gliding motility-associated C-terminal domain-containing protein [Pinibacter aurantiacus]